MSRTLDHKESFSEGNGKIAWNSKWDGRCVECGLEFTSTTRVLTGHQSTSHEGESILQIRGTESVNMVCNYWDYQPTIEVQIKRAVAANAGQPGEGLTEQVSVTLTPEEWYTVFEQLHGPLQILMRQRKWSRDTT